MAADSPVHRYHDGTKHHFERYARSLGYLDWASQPRPFRHYEGAPRIALFPHPDAPASSGPPSSVSYSSLFDTPPAPSELTAARLGDLLRHSLGLSAWKTVGNSRWALRVNPSSGNLHPTEAYLVCPSLPGFSDSPALFHYAADVHAVEQRARFDPVEWQAITVGQPVALLILSSIHWREAWKYGERAFRYCQHDIGHAIAAVAVAARLNGWRAQVVRGWSSDAMAGVAGLDRDADFFEAEREDPACVLALWPHDQQRPEFVQESAAWVSMARGAEWHGRASQLSEDHVDWSFIDEVAEATRQTHDVTPLSDAATDTGSRAAAAVSAPTAMPEGIDPASPIDARRLLLQRRSAVAFDGQTTLDREVFLRMLGRLLPDRHLWDVLWWSPTIHLLLFVHRVNGLEPGLYFLSRTPDAAQTFRQALAREWAWEPVGGELPLFLLGRGDCRGMARRLSCHQDIAADGAFSLGMLAEFDASLAAHGPSFYRRLFWESGVVGQVLYLEAEAAGVRGTGIGCFFDDGVHEVVGLTGHVFQSLYHFTVGGPVEDRRLMTEPGYDWERRV